MQVVLTEHEIAYAYSIAGQMAGQNLTMGRKPRYSADKNGWGLGVIGCLGEMGFAKAINRYWSGNVGNLKAKDVNGIQVRSTDREQPVLILHEGDSDEDYFVLVQIDGNVVNLVGWILGRDGKQQKYWRETARPAFFVPASDLQTFTKERFQ